MSQDSDGTAGPRSGTGFITGCRLAVYDSDMIAADMMAMMTSMLQLAVMALYGKVRYVRYVRFVLYGMKGMKGSILIHHPCAHQ